jgi:hypothetical protein
MDLDRLFARIGASVVIRDARPERRRTFFVRGNADFRIGVESRSGQEYFDVARSRPRVDVQVVQYRTDIRHLVLHVKHRASGAIDKYLCGMDERHWFVAAVPGRHITSVDTAREALIPPQVKRELERLRVPRSAWFERRNAAFVRQGEWFFVPTRLSLSPTLRHEPLVRGTGAKPHILEFAHRKGGETVFVCRKHPSPLTKEEHEKLLAERPAARKWIWRTMVREPELYARGRVWHADHATISLGAVWHRVYVNEEHRAPATRNLTFLD